MNIGPYSKVNDIKIITGTVRVFTQLLHCAEKCLTSQTCKSRKKTEWRGKVTVWWHEGPSSRLQIQQEAQGTKIPLMSLNVNGGGNFSVVVKKTTYFQHFYSISVHIVCFLDFQSSHLILFISPQADTRNFLPKELTERCDRLSLQWCSSWCYH